MVETINKLMRVSRRLVQEYGREPTTYEISEGMEVPPERVREILKVSQEPVSLETPIGEEEDSHLGDFIEDLSAPAPADAATFQLLREQVEGGAGHPQRTGAARAAAPVRPGGWPWPYAGRGGPGFWSNPGAYSPDRGQGASKAATPQPVQEAA